MARVGVFWVVRQTVIGRAIDIAAGEAGVPGLIDSPDNHAGLWESRMVVLYPELRGQEYFAVPRGRVLWDANKGRSIVYLDARLLTPETKAQVAEFFDLHAETTDWCTDAHYNTDQASLTQLFSDP